MPRAPLAILTNIAARANRRDPARVRSFSRLVTESGGLALEPAGPDALVDAAKEIARKNVGVVAINGGDGTLHLAISALARVYGPDAPLPLIALIRGGTMNTVANALGLKGSSHALLSRWVEKFRTGRPFELVERSALAVGDKVGFLFGTGAIAGFLRLYYDTGKPGPLTAGQVLLRGVVSSLRGGAYGRALAKRWRGRVTADGRVWEHTDYLAVGAGSVDQIGLGFKPYPRAGSVLGKFASIGIYTSAPGFIADLPRIWRGLPMREGKAIDSLVSELRFEASEPFEYVMDGDLYPCSGELTLSAGPRVRLVTA